ncbi:MAG TPA: oxygen-independent coproporphyrinogen III oxidase [Chryseosolibacter sp.]
MTDYPSYPELIKKYDVPTPRYTSYPTVPFWNTTEFSVEKWIDAVRRAFEESNDTKGISLYLHLPFCEHLCTYCACNKRITKNHAVEITYIRTLLKEWNDYIRIFGRKPIIRELHLGGGTPTFFSPKNLKWLVSYLLEEGLVHRENEFSFEGHPNNTTEEHLQTLFDLGFKRVSFGVQDLDLKVQKTINRIQPFENLETVTRQSREIGYQSISFDLIYGLPYQTLTTIENTIRQVLSLKPDRVSFYSYAHVPWVSPGQRGYSDADLPSDIQKRALYERGRKLLKENGYEDIGMDHFALPHDALFHAREKGKLHRNFMGYTTTNTDLLIGLGASAISDAKYAYAQNLKKVEDYSQEIAANKLAIFKGHIQSPEDLDIKRHILAIACNNQVSAEALASVDDPAIRSCLNDMCREGILIHHEEGFIVTERGRAFIRNICSLFDKTIQINSSTNTPAVFSRSI